MAKQSMTEKIYECEVKRTFVVDGVKRKKWTLKPVSTVEPTDELRCKDCHGELKLRKKSATGPAHVSHKLQSDSEYCSNGSHFQRAVDGRVPRISETPVA